MYGKYGKDIICGEFFNSFDYYSVVQLMFGEISNPCWFHCLHSPRSAADNRHRRERSRSRRLHRNGADDGHVVAPPAGRWRGGGRLEDVYSAVGSAQDHIAGERRGSAAQRLSAFEPAGLFLPVVLDMPLIN